MRQLTPPVEDYRVEHEPFYLPSSDEVELFEHAWRSQLPILLKGPTGCGKTRFVAYMAWKLQRPLITVACHEDLTASDLLGRFLLQGDDTVWVDGPLTAAVRHGAIVYLDEVVEARKDTLVVIHPLTDDRRILPVDRLATILKAPDPFMMVISYNPGYQSVLKELKPSTRQRFVSLDFTYPPAEAERAVLVREAGIEPAVAARLVQIAEKIRNLTDRGLDEGVSTRLLVYAGKLIAQGSAPRAACRAAFTRTLTDDGDLQRTIEEIVADFFLKWGDRFTRVLGRVDQRLRKAAPAARLARQSSAVARAYLRYRAAVETGLGAEAADLYTDLVLDVADQDAEMARIVAVSLPEHLARVRPERRGAFVHLLREVVAVRVDALPLTMRALPDLVGTMPEGSLRSFLAQALALHAVSPQRAESFLRRESGGGQAAARALKKGVGLPEIQRTLALYARAHCGEDVQVKAGGGRSFSDGHHIYLPDHVDQYGDHRDFLVYRVQTALSAGYLEFGTFNLQVERLTGTWPARQEGEGEVERFFRGFSNRTLARDLFQVLEDGRIEARIRVAYPGVARDIDRLGPAFRGDRPTPSAPAAVAVEALARATWGLPGLAMEPRVATALAPLLALVPRLAELTVDEIAQVVATHYAPVEALMRHVDDEKPPPPREPAGKRDKHTRPTPQGQPQAPGAAVPTPPGGYPGFEPPPLQPRIAPEAAGPDERRIEEEAQRILEQMRARGETGDRKDARQRLAEDARRAAEREAILDAAADLGGASTDGGTGPDKPMNAATGAAMDPDVASVGRTFVYREWDATIEDYKPRWVAVREQVLKEGSAAFVEQVMTRRKPQIDQLRRRFEAFRPQGMVRVRNLPDGDELDIDRQIEAAVDRRMGVEPSERLYTQRHRQERDVAVAFLLDLSSSTNESADGSPRRIIDVEKEALIVAAEALNALGDRFAIWGFSGYGRDNVSFYVAKEFEDPWDARARERIGRMTFKMENRDGAAIRHATRKLLEAPARVRLLFLLSDGRPLDCGCDHYFDRYAQEDTRVALREARKVGVHPFCITVDPTGPQYLARMYGEVAYTVIDKVEALPARLLAVYRKLAM